MSTTSQKAGSQFTQLEELGQQFQDATRKAGTAYLDSYEKAVDGVIRLEQRLAGLAGQEWLIEAVDAQAGATRELVKAYTEPARAALR